MVEMRTYENLRTYNNLGMLYDEKGNTTWIK
jgi:hypothetical protein